uniref:Uncharacterized protein n=1 Tax=Arundo donax TaxID=35708 RepID=A0A0A9EKL1_ARUDO
MSLFLLLSPDKRARRTSQHAVILRTLGHVMIMLFVCVVR